MEKNPEDSHITEDNQYEFIIWALSLKPPSIDPVAFQMVLGANVPKWIEETHVPWIFAYSSTLDTFKGQPRIEKEVRVANLRPTDPEEKRRLFAACFDEKFKKKKRPSNRKLRPVSPFDTNSKISIDPVVTNAYRGPTTRSHSGTS